MYWIDEPKDVIKGSILKLVFLTPYVCHMKQVESLY